MEPHKLSEISENEISELSSGLIATVANGASIGFLSGFTLSEAESYWHSVCSNLSDNLHLWVVKTEGKIVGTIQFERPTKKNGSVRGEIQKLFVDPAFRGRGIASKLVKLAEEYAFSIGISTLVLDTESGSNAEKLYTKLDWVKVGVIPGYALSPSGELKGTTYFYKQRP
ncbi:GNAT family N-acetyltransferase [Pleionea mediterranea]|uniref:Acetyltransferase (GNAT) family protein n=1 Tax=Pleionea mediterranea TaxID=523701 RepID=A0A316FRK2_9GAMM|nr:GNAT family N-acetyltransferase [Pleionea mediterranea]PWK50785.1 acetyltransferase (GNAT) family protein [Pleionea mediterranea]